MTWRKKTNWRVQFLFVRMIGIQFKKIRWRRSKGSLADRKEGKKKGEREREREREREIERERLSERDREKKREREGE